MIFNIRAVADIDLETLGFTMRTGLIQSLHSKLDLTLDKNILIVGFLEDFTNDTPSAYTQLIRSVAYEVQEALKLVGKIKHPNYATGTFVYTKWFFSRKDFDLGEIQPSFRTHAYMGRLSYKMKLVKLFEVEDMEDFIEQKGGVIASVKWVCDQIRLSEKERQRDYGVTPGRVLADLKELPDEQLMIDKMSTLYHLVARSDGLYWKDYYQSDEDAKLANLHGLKYHDYRDYLETSKHNILIKTRPTCLTFVN